MAKRRVQNGKRIEREVVTSADGRKLEIDIYMVKDGYPSRTTFRAICDEIDLDETGDDVDEVTKRALKIARERCDITWEPYLRLRIKGVRPKVRDGERIERELFDTSRNAWGKTEARFSLEIEVDAIELATIGDKKVHRNKPTRDDKAPQVSDGWPKTGREERDYWNRDEPRDMRALVKDTPENRDALVRIREAMADLTARLDDILGPENAENTLGRILTGGIAMAGSTMPMLPAPAEVGEDRVRIEKDFPGTYPASLKSSPPPRGKIRRKP